MVMGGSAGGAHVPLLALVLALFMFGYVMWEAGRLPALAGPTAMLAGSESAAATPCAALTQAVSQPAAGAQTAGATQATQIADAATDEAAPGTGVLGGGPVSLGSPPAARSR